MGADFQFWSMPAEEVLKKLGSSLSGLSSKYALSQKAPAQHKEASGFRKDMLLFFSQFKSPLTLLLILALVLSSFLFEFTESTIIFSILLLSGVLGFIQERKAGRALEKLRMLIKSKVKVRRDNEIFEIPADEVVSGDIVLLEAGNIVPADSLILEEKDLYINEAVLTGESFPAEKRVGLLEPDIPIIKKTNTVFKGTNVISGTAMVLAVRTEQETELGKIETDLGRMNEETAFEKGIKHFGYMLLRIALLLSGIVIIANIWLGKNPLDSILFALALSVGLTPELLPAIVTITLSEGAKRMARKKIIVKKLSSIQNLGSIDVLCSDKTGTLTEGEVTVHSYVSADNKPNSLVEKYAYLNAYFESGYPNPMDIAIRKKSQTDISAYKKFDEVPYDFIRKRLSIVVEFEKNHVMITKGALKNILEICDKVQTSDGVLSIGEYAKNINEAFKGFSEKGFRTIGLCYKDVTDDPIINKDDENKMIFLGFILLYDPPKKNIAGLIKELEMKKVALKVITGDNILIAENIASQIGIPSHRIISGGELHLLSDEAIISRANDIDIFAEIEPTQKERIVRALQSKGHVVGYLGDGINDASALKAADVGISVNNASDVAKESADMILVEKNLSVIIDGILEGRKTYINTLKYIFIATSANFGNMLSMAGASLFLPFLPLLPSQILLTNLLSDIPALTIASDKVDNELTKEPKKWDIKLIRKFMFVFGLESSLFDFLTFGTLLFIFKATPGIFRTGWFVESIITEILILLIIRTRKTFLRSRIGKGLAISSACVILVTLTLPYIPFVSLIGLYPLPLKILLSVLLIAILYASMGEMTKKYLFKKLKY